MEWDFFILAKCQNSLPLSVMKNSIKSHAQLKYKREDQAIALRKRLRARARVPPSSAIGNSVTKVVNTVQHLEWQVRSKICFICNYLRVLPMRINPSLVSWRRHDFYFRINICQNLESGEILNSNQIFFNKEIGANVQISGNISKSSMSVISVAGVDSCYLTLNGDS